MKKIEAIIKPYKLNDVRKAIMDICDRCVDAIIDAANTGNIGDGKVFVSPIEWAVRVRTREENSAAL